MRRKFTTVWTAGREAKGLSVEDAANRAKVNKVTVYRALANNGATLQVATLEALCRAVGVRPQDCWV